MRYEFSFDRYHKNAERIYRLATDFHFGTFQGKYAASNNPAGPTLQRDYRIDVGVGLYALAGLLALAIALLTVSYQTIKATRGNPVDALRYE